MSAIDEFLVKLPRWHRRALHWFHERAGQETTWPKPLSGGTLLATKAKGIFKPRASEYALSVRQTLGGRYPDREPVHRSDGTWRYEYFQEADDPTTVEKEYTNRGLLACLRDEVPVGVMRQTHAKPHVRYHVLGLALVVDWKDGYFALEGFAPGGQARRAPGAARMGVAARSEAQDAVESGAFDPGDEKDARERILAAIVRRRGQPAFRASLIEAYQGRCAITGCDATVALEAAHIVPYRGAHTNVVTNGLLLRADIHTLFDLGLIAVDSDSMQVIISSSLSGTAYADLAGRGLAKPALASWAPSREALKSHRGWAGL